jgi:hypothetical protein
MIVGLMAQIPPDRNGDRLVEAWLEAVRECYRLSKAERSHQLRGRRIKFMDGRGVHPLSEAFGRQTALFTLAELPAELAVDMPTIRREAELDAEADFAEEVRERGAEVFADARAANRGASR